MTGTASDTARRVDYAAATDAGLVRPGNEDAHGAVADQGLFAVADGLGGHRAGEEASALAVAGFLETFPAHGDIADERRGAFLVAAVGRAHDAVRAATAADQRRAGMGTTLVAAWIPPDRDEMWVVNVGDSRAYLLHEGALEGLTLDDTLLEAMRRAGTLPADPALWPPRQQLTQALGPMEFVVPRVTVTSLSAGDRMLLCTDGLTDMVDDAEITTVLAGEPDPERACAELIRMANRNGGIDNVTVVVIALEAAAP
jgi:protein phosphatase